MNFWERVEFELDKKGINKKTLVGKIFNGE